MTEYETIAVDKSGPIVTITLNRPEAANVMNLTFVRELAAIAAHCAFGDAKVVVLTGAGRFFCAGGDLGDVAAATDRPFRLKEIADSLHRAVSTFSRMDAILITAVNGIAAGAGFPLAVIGDLVLAAESASFTMSYTRVGLSPDGSASYYLPRLIGIRRTQELMLTNRRLGAAEARDWGLVTEVVADDHLRARAHDLAEQFATGPAQANGAIKKLLLTTFSNGLEQQMELEGQLIAQNGGSHDGHEGVDAFVAKRTPQFS